MTILGIDPGKKGAVVIQADGQRYVEPLAGTVHDLFTQFQKWSDHDDAPIAFLEQVGGFVGKVQPASSAFRFGHSVGVIEGILVALGFEIRRVRPQAWQKHFSALSRPGEAKPDHKRRLRALAQERCPQLRKEITLVTCDALLILLFACDQIEHGVKK